MATTEYEIDLEDFDRRARIAFDRLPETFRALCGNVVIHVADEAEPEILADFGIADPLELTGLFEGVAFADAEAAPPSHVHLYRLAILAELQEYDDISLDDLIVHVLVHEIGHHFGLSDEDMDAIEEASE